MTLRERLARDLFVKLCERIRVGTLQVTMPGGQVHVFEGEHSPEIRAEMEIADPRFFPEVLGQGDWGLGWSFVGKRWDAKSPGAVARILMLNEPVFRPLVDLGHRLSPTMRRVLRLDRNNQRLEEEIRRRTVGECYDVGNDFFRFMLGPSMVYTCAIWPHADATLEEAQENKHRIVAEKARIRPGDRVADLGCGWGTLAAYLQRTTGAVARGIALSRNQIAWAREHHPEVEYDYLNYAHLDGCYDAIVSVGLGEHVGRPHLADFLRLVSEHLVPGGRFVMHTMTSHDGVLMRSRKERWTSFGSVVMPNGDVPSLGDIVAAAMSTGRMRILHTESFGVHYARTSQAWIANLRAHRDEIVSAYSEALYRTYEYAIGMGGVAMETGMTLSHIVFENRPYGADLTHAVL